METELKSCPFCGDNNLRIIKDFSFAEDLSLKITECLVSCLNCGASGPSIVFVENAIEGWNKRIKKSCNVKI